MRDERGRFISTEKTETKTTKTVSNSRVRNWVPIILIGMVMLILWMVTYITISVYKANKELSDTNIETICSDYIQSYMQGTQ